MIFTIGNNLPGFKVQRKKFGIGSLIMLMAFGAIFGGIGYFVVGTAKIDPSWTKVDGVIVSSSAVYGAEGDTTYAPVVAYKVNNQEYQVKSTTSSSFQPDVGGSKQVAYNPSTPQNAKVVAGSGEQAFMYLFPAVGGFIFLLAPILYARSAKRTASINNLMQTGQKLQGVLVDIQQVGSSNNSMSYKIVVSASDPSGTVHNYVSDDLGGIGGLAMSNFQATPIPIDVYVDTGNPQNYYVDVSDIPNLTPERIAQLVQSASQPQSIAPPEPANLQTQPAPTQPVPVPPSSPLPPSNKPIA